MASPDKTLYDLLVSLFPPDELRRLLTHTYGHDLAASLPVGGTPSKLAFEAAQELRRRGHVASPLFAALVHASPARYEDIAAVAQAWGLPRPSPAPVPTPPPAPDTAKSVARDPEAWDVFISYAREDLVWVAALATHLHDGGLRVFFDEWEINAGDVVSHRIDVGLRGSRAGILVVSDTALARPWVAEEYAGLLGSAVERGQRLIPVLHDVTDLSRLPTGLRSRQWLDFRGVTGSTYQEMVARLAAVLRGQRPGPPPRGGIPIPPSS